MFYEKKNKQKTLKTVAKNVICKITRTNLNLLIKQYRTWQYGQRSTKTIICACSLINVTPIIRPRRSRSAAAYRRQTLP